jgi:hypothetical protein
LDELSYETERCCQRADQEARELLFKKSNKHEKIAMYCGSRSEHVRDEFILHAFTRVEASRRGSFEVFLAVS